MSNQTDSQRSQGAVRRRAPIWIRIIKALTLTALGVVLFIVGILTMCVSILTPERLTPIVERVATSQLQNAYVHIDRVELSIKKTIPYLNIDIRGLSVISSALRAPALDTNKDIPRWADTVLTVKHFSGGINPFVVVGGHISLSDVTIEQPAANYVVVNDTLTNIDIFPPSPEPKQETPFDWSSLPRITMKRFAIVGDMPIRYLDTSTGTSVKATFRDISLDGNKNPHYTLAIDGNVESSMLRNYYSLPQVDFGLDGDMVWNQADPMRLQINNMSLALSLLRGNLDIGIDARQGLVIDKLAMALHPVEISQALDLLPQPFKEECSIPSGMVTNATIAVKARLTEPFNVASTSLPHCTVNIDIPDSRLSWQRVRLNNLAANIDIIVPGDSINDIRVKINRLNARGPATDMTLQATVTSLMDDPVFDGTMRGTCSLQNLPPALTRLIPGQIRGRLTADARIKGRPSYFSIEGYHKLYAEGNMAIADFSYTDSTNSVYASRATFNFGTKTRSKATEKTLLTARITVDSASVQQEYADMRITQFNFSIGAVNGALPQSKTSAPAIIPMGGRIEIGDFRLIIPGDTAKVRARGISGHAYITGHEQNMHTPELRFDVGINRFAAGDRNTRIMLRKAHTDFTAYVAPQSRRAKAIRQLADSVAREHRNIPMDSVYAISRAIYDSRLANRPRKRRQTQPDSTEVIDFGDNRMVAGILDNWRLQGDLTAERASLYTPYFPLRNRLRNINLSFNNDSIVMHDVRYKAGHSDFTMSGTVRNLRRVFTSRNRRQSLYINLVMTSDTIDVNQLAETAFAGSAYAQNATGANAFDIDNDDETQLETAVSKRTENATDSMGPILIPQNVEAQLTLNAKNILYSDLHLRDMRGKAMTYQGALNLHELSARSDIGSVNLSALYVGRQADSLQFGFGLQVDRFNINRFLQLVPAIDSIMPLLRDFGGIISADIAATTQLSPSMDFDLNSLRAAIKLEGDSLVLLDPATFKSLSKWLMFKDKERNIIDRMSVQMLVENNRMQLFPFMFNIDRYKLGVQGYNDLAMNFNYHIAVLKSPIPFKFGINLKGNPDDFKIRLGGAKFNEKQPMDVPLVDTTRVNLIRSIESIFRRGVRNSRLNPLNINKKSLPTVTSDMGSDTLSHADSLQFIRQGLIDAPDTTAQPVDKAEKKRKKAKKKDVSAVSTLPDNAAAMPLAAVLRRKDGATRNA